MAAGTVHVAVVENPTATTVDTAMGVAIAATDPTARFSVINLGQHIMIVAVSQA